MEKAEIAYRIGIRPPLASVELVFSKVCFCSVRDPSASCTDWTWQQSKGLRRIRRDGSRLRQQAGSDICLSLFVSFHHERLKRERDEVYIHLKSDQALDESMMQRKICL
jgi:hypothetical protein